MRRSCETEVLGWRSGGAEGDRTLDLCIANAALSQLSYRPTLEIISGTVPGAVPFAILAHPQASRAMRYSASRKHSAFDQLSYRPTFEIISGTARWCGVRL